MQSQQAGTNLPPAPEYFCVAIVTAIGTRHLAEAEMSKLVIALAFVAGIASSPALARATNPSERPAHAEQQVGQTSAPVTSTFGDWR